MPDAPSAMLFCPPQAPVALHPGTPVRIGRHSSCDLTVVRNAVSRMHAEVYVEGSSYRLRDNGSRNGTYVDGVRVEGDVELKSGAKIEIGPVVITFCQIDGAPVSASEVDDANGALTLSFDRASQAGAAMSGKLEEIPAFAVFQLIELSRSTGIMEVRWRGELARMWFDQGAPVHAETEKNLGADAALALMRADEGDFRFDAQPVSVDSTIRASITELLLESCRLQDEEVT